MAKPLGLGLVTVRRWVVQADIGLDGREGMTSAEHAEIKQLKAENRGVTQDAKILDAVTTFFAGALGSRKR